jgi:glycosyltransferase involved in cell wall biosynthesis
MATGHVVFACKPLLTTLGPALVATDLGKTKPLILDVEDDEWVPMGRNLAEFVWRDLVKGWRHATAWKYTILMHPLTYLVGASMVASTKLQKRYGGTVVLHGPDERVFDPDSPRLDKAACRRELRLPSHTPLALFAGLPQPHKGWAILLDALHRSEARSWDLVLVGDPRHPDFDRAGRSLGHRCHFLGFVPYDRLPSVMAAADAVPVPSLAVRFAQSQVSAKALDALAMKCALLASRVGDFPRILGEGDLEKRGWLHTPGDAAGLARDLNMVVSDPQERETRTMAGRRWYLQEACAGVIRLRIEAILDRLMAGKAFAGES